MARQTAFRQNRILLGKRLRTVYQLPVFATTPFFRTWREIFLSIYPIFFKIKLVSIKKNGPDNCQGRDISTETDMGNDYFPGLGVAACQLAASLPYWPSAIRVKLLPVPSAAGHGEVLL
jgi:hypothetical protein